MKRFLIIMLAVLIVSALIIGGCAAPAPTPAPKPAPGPAPTPAEQPIGNITLSFGATNVGSASYAVGAAVTRMVQKYNPTITATVEVAGGGPGMLKLIKTKELEFGYSSNIDMYNAYRGTGDAKETGPQNVRALWTGHNLLYQWIT